GDERYLGRVGRMREHRLAVEHPADCYAVQATNQHPVLPAFERMGVAGTMQACIGGAHFLAEPGAGLAARLRVAPRRRAAREHFAERGVDLHDIALVAY